MVHM